MRIATFLLVSVVPVFLLAETLNVFLSGIPSLGTLIP